MGNDLGCLFFCTVSLTTMRTCTHFLSSEIKKRTNIIYNPSSKPIHPHFQTSITQTFPLDSLTPNTLQPLPSLTPQIPNQHFIHQIRRCIIRHTLPLRKLKIILQQQIRNHNLNLMTS